MGGRQTDTQWRESLGIGKGLRVRGLWRKEGERKEGEKGEAEITSSEMDRKREKGRERNGGDGGVQSLSLKGTECPGDRAGQQNYNCNIPAFIL